MHYSMSRLSLLDVRWVDLFDVSANPTFYEAHSNPFYELIVVAEGTVKLQTGQRRETLHMGDSLLLMPWEQHAGWGAAEGNSKFFWVQFSCDPGMEPYELNQVSEIGIVHAERTELRTLTTRHEDLIIVPRNYRSENPYKLLNRFEELVETMKQPSGYFRFRATNLLAEMLRLLADGFLKQGRFDTGFPISYVTFHKLANYLNNFYESNITSDRLEAALDRKYEYLGQVFKKYAGISISRYIQQLRVQRAKYLLQHTERSVKEVSEEVGFQDPFYFSRIFKRLEGVSPQHYRETD